MTKIAISKFKATCLDVLQQVNEPGEPILVTKRGKPIAQVVPPAKRDVFGCMAGTGEILGDIVSPAFDESEWDMLRD